MLKKDCRYFTGDRPCNHHKREGIKCNDCNYYSPIDHKILIIKLDAIGDVLRTTSILTPLKKKFVNSYITWCTRAQAKDLFISNTFVDEVITIEDDAYFRLKSEEFDIVINLDTSKLSSSIASMAAGKERVGFVLNKKGFVEATSPEAEDWLNMSAFDDVKKANIKTYQQIIYDILRLEGEVARPVLNISEDIKVSISRRADTWLYDGNKLTIGLNVGVGTKWPNKGWPLSKWIELIKNLDEKKFNIFLLGGSEEVEVVNNLKTQFNYLTITGCDNSLREFSAIVDMCDFIITADTLALHIATALGKKIVALFGPTSANEIELYGSGVKLSSPDGCKCFYSRFCKEKVSCMEKITADMVIKEIASMIG